MKNLLLAIIALLGVDASAQNLVPNGSFEQFTTNCNFGLGYNSLQDWTDLDCAASPGLAHACNSSLGNGSGVPQGGLGFQYSHSGDGFILVTTLRMNSQGGFPDGNPQSYANVDLTQPLVAGQHYCLRFWINMADSSCYRTSAFHAFLWYGTPSVCNYQDTAWDTYAAVTFDISGVDTAGWTLLEAGFEASGGESNLTLGAFQTLDEIDSVFIADHSNSLGSLPAIYFIDDVELWACEVGVEEHANDRLRMYPNPANDLVRIALNTGEEAGTVSVLDVQGRVVLQQAFRGAQADLDVSGFSSGAYVVQLRTDRTVLSAPLQVVR
jgi:hypothetical protein